MVQRPPTAAEIEQYQAAKEAHDKHAELMKQIETRAWQEAEEARWALADELEGIFGVPQPMILNPFRNWKV